MAWKIEFRKSARDDLARLDRVAARRITRFLAERLAPRSNARELGKMLHGQREGIWRYRVGDYRILCRIEDDTSTILVLAVGPRRSIYR